MFHHITLPVVAPGLLIAVGVLFVTAVFLLILPLRGGNGQHAGAGPGALTVWSLRDSLRSHSRYPEFAELFRATLRADRAERQPGPARLRARTEPPPYVGAHRLRVERVADVVHPRVQVHLEPGAFRPH